MSESAPEYRIGDLAAEAGIPVRTLRYYQERGLLPRPRRQGRVGLYSRAHLERLRLIAALLERGYRLDGIEELLAAAGEGREVTELLGLERAAGAPWVEPGEVRLGRSQVAEVFGAQFTEEVLAEAVELGYVRVEGEEVVHTSPRLLAATVELVRLGVPLKAVVAMGWELQAAFDRVAYGFVRLVRTHLLDPALSGAAEAPDGLDRLAEAVAALRPVARTVADEHFARAMDARVGTELAEVRADVRDRLA